MSLQIVCVVCTGSPSWFKTENCLSLSLIANDGQWFTFPVIITLFYQNLPLVVFFLAAIKINGKVLFSAQAQ